MSATIRTLIVWLALLAVPFQGFAAAAMLPCASVTPATAAHAGHQHHRMHAMAGTHDHHDGTVKQAHHDGKCGNCAACCIGAAIAPPLMGVAAPHGAPERAATFHAGHVPSADPDLPERPPRTARA